ncbi:hypothetical protein ACQ4PT_036435 [Festuca glaucescens]
MVSASTVLTLLGFCASVLFIVFVCSRLVCTLIRRVRRRPSPPLPRFPPLAARGGYSSQILSSSRCIVCLAEYEDDDFLRVLPYCGHDFHVACVDIWLKQHSTCPVCRVSLRGNPGIKHAVPPRPSEVIVIPPCSPEVSGSDPCRCLFGGRGHSPRTSSEVLTNELDQANQIQVVCHPPSEDRGNSLTPSEVRSPGENNNQTPKLNIESPRVVGIP